MGIPSVSILLHEIIKLMYHAKAKEPIFFRIGTCGGIGIDGGNVIITEEALNADLKPYHELVSLINDTINQKTHSFMMSAGRTLNTTRIIISYIDGTRKEGSPYEQTRQASL
jgi:uridine phosphorylase